jgi:hypothetical protein
MSTWQLKRVSAATHLTKFDLYVYAIRWQEWVFTISQTSRPG